jgi:uracil-DNA glycosylase
VSWTERQRQMLDVMGLVTWAPPQRALPPEVQGDDALPAAAPTAAPTAASPAPAAPAPPRAPQSVATVQRTQTRPPQAAASPMATSTPVASDDRSRHIATLGWPELRAEVAACTACSLCGTRRQTVFGVGHARAGWLVVGEAPGEQEDLQGEPFVGAAGQLLDSMLRALKLTRAVDGPEPASRRVYIANTLKCRPPRNRNPEPAEMLSCEPFLMRQIALLQPRLVLAMGRFAVQALLRSSEPVGKLRGKVHRYQGVPLVVTYHPAYLLRNLADKARAWDDLCLAASVAESAEATETPGLDPAGTAA